MTNSEQTVDTVLAEEFLLRFTDRAVAELESMPVEDIGEAVATVSAGAAALVLDRLQSSTAAEVVPLLDGEVQRRVLGGADPLRVTAFLARLEEPRREEILERRKEVQIQTINRRIDYNQGLRELVNAA